MDTETALYVSVAVLSAAWLLLAMFTIYLWSQHRTLRRHVEEMSSVSKFRVQKVKMKADSNHAYQNPSIAPGEELSRRGYSMYSGEQDLESGLGQGQNSNPVFVEDVVPRNQPRQQPTTAPPFLLQSIEANKRKSLSNPIANSNSNSNSNQRQTNRHSSSNPNFIY